MKCFYFSLDELHEMPLWKKSQGKHTEREKKKKIYSSGGARETEQHKNYDVVIEISSATGKEKAASY